jgi:hypothetical protein
MVFALLAGSASEFLCICCSYPLPFATLYLTLSKVLAFLGISLQRQFSMDDLLHMVFAFDTTGNLRLKGHQ